MDTGSDFLQPEFLNILFFEQKNLVIFPYIDLKHLHALDIFSVGHSVVDLESTALYNLKEMIEYESSTYSQTPSFYFIYNLDQSKLKEIMGIKGIRCVVNINEDVAPLANGSNFIFYNKKAQKFINYIPAEHDLSLEASLISGAGDKETVFDKVNELRILSKRIYNAANEGSDIKELLSRYDQKHWKKLVEYVERSQDIIIPNKTSLLSTSPSPKNAPNKKNPPAKVGKKSFAKEYAVMVETNKVIGKEFIQLLHDYGEILVDPPTLARLFNPGALYDHIRARVWKEGVPDEFFFAWIQFQKTGKKHDDQTYADFEHIFSELGISEERFNHLMASQLKVKDAEPPKVKVSPPPNGRIPSIQDFEQFKVWMDDKLTKIEKKLGLR